jgi:hypothetical protein
VEVVEEVVDRSQANRCLLDAEAYPPAAPALFQTDYFSDPSYYFRRCFPSGSIARRIRQKGVVAVEALVPVVGVSNRPDDAVTLERR